MNKYVKYEDSQEQNIERGLQLAEEYISSLENRKCETCVFREDFEDHSTCDRIERTKYPYTVPFGAEAFIGSDAGSSFYVTPSFGCNYHKTEASLKEPTYEYQWYYVENGSPINAGWKTYEEVAELHDSVQNERDYYVIPETKQERKQ